MWIELSTAVGEALWGLRKGAGHKYIRRVPKPGGGYRYYYRATGATRAVGADLLPGAKFKLSHEGQAGHFEVVRRAGNQVVLRHDESGGTMTVDAGDLGDLLKREHADVVGAAQARAKRDLEAARKHGSPKQIARMEARAKRLGVEAKDSAPHQAEPPPAPSGSLLDEMGYGSIDEFVDEFLGLSARGAREADIRGHDVLEGADPGDALMRLWQSGAAVPLVNGRSVPYANNSTLPKSAVWRHRRHAAKRGRRSLPPRLRSADALRSGAFRGDIRTERDVRKLIKEAELGGASAAVKRELQRLLKDKMGVTEADAPRDGWRPWEQMHHERMARMRAQQNR